MAHSCTRQHLHPSPPCCLPRRLTASRRDRGNCRNPTRPLAHRVHNQIPKEGLDSIHPHHYTPACWGHSRSGHRLAHLTSTGGQQHKILPRSHRALENICMLPEDVMHCSEEGKQKQKLAHAADAPGACIRALTNIRRLLYSTDVPAYYHFHSGSTGVKSLCCLKTAFTPGTCYSRGHLSESHGERRAPWRRDCSSLWL